jgi:hypothetical protein
MGYKIEILCNEHTELVEIKQKVLTDMEGQVIKLSLTPTVTYQTVIAPRVSQWEINEKGKEKLCFRNPLDFCL